MKGRFRGFGWTLGEAGGHVLKWKKAGFGRGEAFPILGMAEKTFGGAFPILGMAKKTFGGAFPILGMAEKAFGGAFLILGMAKKTFDGAFLIGGMAEKTFGEAFLIGGMGPEWPGWRGRNLGRDEICVRMKISFA